MDETNAHTDPINTAPERASHHPQEAIEPLLESVAAAPMPNTAVDASLEAYEILDPEGISVDADVMNTFSASAQELSLSKDSAQKLLDKVAPVMMARQAAKITEMQKSWAESSKIDTEFGGDKLNENLAIAKRSLETFGTPEFKALLNESGFGNHPEVIRFLYRAGCALSEDRFVSGRAATPTQSIAATLYDNTK